MSAARRWAVVRWALVGLVVPLAARAQAPSAPSATDKAVAEALFREGRSLMAAGRTAEACAKLEGSYRIDPKTGTLTNLAACHELEGKTASAWAEFTEAAAKAATAKRTSLEQLARARAAELEPRLARLAIRLPEEPRDAIVVALDGRPLVAEALAGALPVDPGPHEIRATRGEAAWATTVVAPPGPSRVEIAIPALSAPPPQVAAAPPERPPPPLPPPPLPRSRGRRAATYLAVGTGGAGLVAGSILGLAALGAKRDGDALCQGTLCGSQRGVDLHEDARTKAAWSTAAFAVGIAASAVALYLWLTEPRPTTGLVGRF